MSQLTTAYSERLGTEGSRSTNSYAASATPVLSSGSFTAGKKYLILARSEVRASAVGAQVGIKLRHGTTDFPGSEMLFTQHSSVAGERALWHYMTVWTAVSSEAVEIMTKGDGTNNCADAFTTLTAIKLSDDLTEDTDWKFAESTSATQLTTNYQDGASVSITPGTGGNSWLCITDSQIDLDSNADEFCSRLDRDAGTGGQDAILKGRNAVDIRQLPNIWLGTLTAAAHTFKEQGKRIGTSASTAHRHRSAVFILNVSKLDVATYTVTDAHLDGTAGNWTTTAATASHSQAVDNGKVLVLGFLHFEPQTDNGDRYDTARVQDNQADIYSGYTTFTPIAKFQYPQTQASGLNGQQWPYALYWLGTMGAGTHDVDLDFGVVGTAAKGVGSRRVAALSLDVSAPPPPAGAGGAVGALERTEQLMYQNDYRASRRRVLVRCVNKDDNVSAEISEAGGQPAIAKNGGSFGNTSATLTNHDNTNGLYYVTLTPTELDTPGSLRIRYKGTNTALFTAVLAVEECPWLDDGTAAGGGANYIDLEATVGGERTIPSAIAPGSIVRIVGGTGAGQSQIVSSYASPRCTMEQNWVTNPDNTSKYVVLPGLPPFVTDVNVTKIAGDATAATKLAAGASALLTFTVQSGVNNTTTVTTDLPITVGGTTTPQGFYKDRTLYFRTGKMGPGEEALIVDSVVSGSYTVLTVSLLSENPTVGDTGVVA